MLINLKGEKSIDPFELETAEGAFIGFFLPSRGQTVESCKTHVHPFSHSKLQDLTIYNVTKNLELGFFTEYLVKKSGADLPFSFYLLVLYFF